MGKSSLFSEIILPKSLKKTLKCDMCGKPLSKRHVTHKNIDQDVVEHKFCSKPCKNKWCHIEREKTL